MDQADSLEKQYRRRFDSAAAYRDRVWQTLLRGRIQAWVGEDQEVLDLGCGWGEFIRNVRARARHAMDLNPDAAELAGPGVNVIQQDCSQAWPLPDESLDVVFSSNFIEHLPDKASIDATLAQAHRCLRPGGRAIFLGPNIRFVPGAYWDFWDHHVAISDQSLAEALELSGFKVETQIPRFLPYTMSDGREIPMALVRLYLAMPVFWPLFGKQFLLLARKQS